MILADETLIELIELRECLRLTYRDLYQAIERHRQKGEQIRILASYVLGWFAF